MLKRMLRQIMPARVLAGPLPRRLWPILLVGYACLLPRELTVYLADAALFPYRLALLVMTPFALANLARAPVRFSMVDFFAIFASVWFSVALLVTTSVEAGLISGVSNGIDLGLAYLLGRSSVRTAEDLRLVLRGLLPGVLLLVAVLALESLSHRMLLRPLLAELLGLPQPDLYYRARFGLLRAMGPFPHPILGGVFLVSLLPLMWYLAHDLRARLAGTAAAFGAIFTVSSTALIGLALGIGLIALELVQRLTRVPAFLLTGLYACLAAVFIAFGSQGGLVWFLVRRLSLDSDSGLYRMWIWEYGGAEALANPWFGIGQRDWVRPDYMFSASVDTYWLVLAMAYGFPALVAVLGMMLGTMLAVARTQKYRHPVDRNAGMAIIGFVAIALFSGLTVHFWEALLAWMILLTGCGASLASEARRAQAPRLVPTPDAALPAAMLAEFPAARRSPVGT